MQILNLLCITVFTAVKKQNKKNYAAILFYVRSYFTVCLNRQHVFKKGALQQS